MRRPRRRADGLFMIVHVFVLVLVLVLVRLRVRGHVRGDLVSVQPRESARA